MIQSIGVDLRDGLRFYSYDYQCEHYLSTPLFIRLELNRSRIIIMK